ncbi:MAG: nitrogenase component 1 [Candidatus Methanomethylophilaceae archaeon]
MSYRLDQPECMLGHILALEGVKDSASMIHGPSGCKMYPSELCERSYNTRKERPESRNVFSIQSKYYSYQPRLPCTFLDEGTYISGAADRLEELYASLVSSGPGLIGVINSPGSSLIGEDLSRLSSDIPTLLVESTGYSGTLSEGFQRCCVSILRLLSPKREGCHGVNILGLGIWQLNWTDTIDELVRILDLCGIDVITAPFAGSSTEDLKASANAELNIVVIPEYGEDVARYYESEFGIPYVTCVPLGFDAMDGWIRTVCSALGKDPTPALEDLASWRRRSAQKISALAARHMHFRGMTFSVESDESVVSAVTDFLYGYLGLIPVALNVPEGTGCASVIGRYAEKGIPISDDVWNTPADVAVAKGTVIQSLMERGMVRGGSDMAAPSRTRVSILDTPLMGTVGTVLLLQNVIDSLAKK